MRFMINNLPNFVFFKQNIARSACMMANGLYLSLNRLVHAASLLIEKNITTTGFKRQACHSPIDVSQFLSAPFG